MSGPTYHFWLKPSGAATRSWRALFGNSLSQLDAPVFAPHATVLEHLAGTELERVRRSACIAERLQAFDVVLTEPSWGHERFRAIFMRVQRTAIMEANALARRAFDSDNAVVTPHLSLAYGVWSEARKREIVAGQPPEVRTSFKATALHLIRADRSNLEDWHDVARFELRPPLAGASLRLHATGPSTSLRTAPLSRYACHEV